jgi:hypothetical protein
VQGIRHDIMLVLLLVGRRRMQKAKPIKAWCIRRRSHSSGIGQGAFLLSSPIVVPLVVDGCVEAETVVLRGVLSGIGGRATLDSMESSATTVVKVRMPPNQMIYQAYSNMTLPVL